ncbi:hypothetical protein AVEN_257998-1 [Araneus ventricosus]|uniref:Uncharacterized protein n=1 Tax=Araneus ventricosus TaxID=182803 RepID=A0A4Y2FK16_ARAVE|nr:hypothetical protein AVEN_257998-1 [Araneus ventricosus]
MQHLIELFWHNTVIISLSVSEISFLFELDPIYTGTIAGLNKGPRDPNKISSSLDNLKGTRMRTPWECGVELKSLSLLFYFLCLSMYAFDVRMSPADEIRWSPVVTCFRQ